LPPFPRAEIEKAFKHFMAVGESADWNAWADLHTEDGIWVEHHLGTFRGREEIRKGIVEVMAQSPPMEFPVEWCLIEGNRLVYYPWQVFVPPAGPHDVYRFRLRLGDGVRGRRALVVPGRSLQPARGRAGAQALDG
jgi:hypothetical protein